MDKKIAGLLGAAAALTAVNTAQAAAPATAAIGPAAVSYRDLLEPIPNALALLKNEDTQGTEARTDGQTRLVQHHIIITIAIIGGIGTITIIITTVTITTTTEIEKFCN